MSYIALYYFVAMTAILSIPAFIQIRNYKDWKEFRTFVLFCLTLMYAAGMSRTAGVDIGVYFYAFEHDYKIIPDIGFQIIIIVFNYLGLPFLVMMLAIGAVNYFAVYRLARYYGVSFGLLYIIWFLHSVIVRDFSQLRISLAVSIAMLGIISAPKKIKLGFYIVSVSVHISAIVFILVYEACKIVSTVRSVRRQMILILIISVIIISIGSMLPHFDFLDERITVYLNWEEEGYGNPVGSLTLLYFHALVVMLSICFYPVWSGDQRLRALFYMEILGIVSFIALSDYSIFAFRLSHLIFTLYPILIISIITGVGQKRSRYTGMTSILLLWFFSFILVIRPGSIDILNDITSVL